MAPQEENPQPDSEGESDGRSSEKRPDGDGPREARNGQGPAPYGSGGEGPEKEGPEGKGEEPVGTGGEEREHEEPPVVEAEPFGTGSGALELEKVEANEAEPVEAGGEGAALGKSGREEGGAEKAVGEEAWAKKAEAEEAAGEEGGAEKAEAEEAAGEEGGAEKAEGVEAGPENTVGAEAGAEEAAREEGMPEKVAGVGVRPEPLVAVKKVEEAKVEANAAVPERIRRKRKLARPSPPAAGRPSSARRRSGLRDLLVLVIGLLVVVDLLQYLYFSSSWSRHFAIYNAAFLSVLSSFVVIGLVVLLLGWRTVYEHSPRKLALLVVGTVLAVISLGALLVTRQGGLLGLLMGLVAVYSLVLMTAGQFESGRRSIASLAVLVTGMALITLVPVHEAFGVYPYGDMLARPNVVLLVIGTVLALVGGALVVGAGEAGGRPAGYFGLWLVGLMSLFLVPFHEAAGISSNSVYGILDQTLMVTGAVATIAGVLLFLRKRRQDSAFMHHVRQGDILYAEGYALEAIEHYDMAIDLNPGYAEAWAHKGSALERLEKLDKAKECLMKALELDPDSIGAMVALASVYRRLGKPKKALELSERALELSPEFVVAWTNKGNALADLDRRNEALDAFDRAVGLNPAYHKAWYNKGVLLAAQGKFKEALGCFDEALELAPNDQRALRAREHCYRELGVARAEG